MEEYRMELVDEWNKKTHYIGDIENKEEIPENNDAAILGFLNNYVYDSYWNFSILHFNPYLFTIFHLKNGKKVRVRELEVYYDYCYFDAQGDMIDISESYETKNGLTIMEDGEEVYLEHDVRIERKRTFTHPDCNIKITPK